ncbi:MAG: sigma-70 family RNA polymerase sigma factor [Acidobacteria bacterium]|jgi:RNA polymerase sigma-70 factor (ECF subfamily)|nr:sigma-70 family RNA polymerase sigma factor [Acidobacteriota bacterium]
MEWALDWDDDFLMTEEAPAGDRDTELMLLFQAGDEGAFEALFARHSRPLIRFASRFVHNRERAEELAQEILLKVYEGADRYRPTAKFTTWLYRIATNVCLNEIRRPWFRAARRSIDASPEAAVATHRELRTDPDPVRDLERQAIARALAEALSLIPDRQRAAFILNKYQELSYAEVGEVMKTSEKAVKSMIHRAREALAARLAPMLPEYRKP